MRIARNLLRLKLPYFNPSEAVMGSSTHLWISILAAYGYLSGSDQFVKDHFMEYLSLFSSVGVFALTSVLLKSKYSSIKALLLSFLITSVLVLPISAGLMETPFAVLLFLLSIYFISVREQFIFAGLFAGLAFLTRYEFSLWIVIAFFSCPNPEAKKGFAKGAFPPLILFSFYCFYFFGTLIPQPVIAKSKVYDIGYSGFFERLRMPFVHDRWAFPWVAFLCLVVSVGALLKKTLSLENAPIQKGMSMFSVGLFCLYFLTKTCMFEWYWPIVLVPLAISLLLAFPTLNFINISIISLFLLFIWPFERNFVNDSEALFFGKDELFENYAPGLRVHQYLRIGAEISRDFPNSTILTSEIGGIGWNFPGLVIDGIGLVTPQALDFHPMKVPDERISHIVGAVPPGAVRRFKPDFIVAMEEFGVALRKEVIIGKLADYKLYKIFSAIPPEETAKTGINTVWLSHTIEIWKNSKI